MNVNYKDILIWLNSLNLSNKKILNLMHNIDNFEELFFLPKKGLMDLGLLNESDIDYMIANRDIDKLNWTKAYYNKLNAKIMTIDDEDYPYYLKNIPNPPAILYRKGDILEQDNLAIAIVGSRKITDYGREAVKYLASEIAKLGITIVSGMADGTDSIAHKEALRNGGRTIAVMGTGIDIIYPSKNKSLAAEIEQNGSIITEFPANMKGLPYNFPRRNRIISGLSLGVLIVEAKEKSGSLITASYAAEQGREVFAVPGNINSLYSKGSNKLIQDGAKLVMKVDDILEEIMELHELISTMKDKKVYDISDDANKIIEIMQAGEVTLEEIISASSFDIIKIQKVLAELELMDIIKATSRGTYILKL